MELLLERSPETLSKADQHGRLLLHDAVELAIALPLIESMVRLHPSAVRSADHEGKLPLHCALD